MEFPVIGVTSFFLSGSPSSFAKSYFRIFLFFFLSSRQLKLSLLLKSRSQQGRGVTTERKLSLQEKKAHSVKEWSNGVNVVLNKMSH